MPQITVATLNLRHRADRWLARRELIVSQLVDLQPDLIALQEISMPIGQGRWLRNQVNVRISRMTGRPYRLVQKRKRHLVHGYYEGIGILSKLPVLSSNVISLGYKGRIAVRANVELPNGHTLDFVCAHLHHVAYDKEARLEQAMRITGWLSSGRSRIPYQIVAGDFNETPSGPAIQHMKQIYRSAFAEKHGYEPLATFPTALVKRDDAWSGCLDYIFLSPALGEVVAAKLFCNKAAAHDDTLYPSDHVGLIATLDLPDA